MEKNLDDAIRVVEGAGGFVMLPEDANQERQVRQETHNLEKEQINLEINFKSDFDERKAEAFSEATHALNTKKDLSFQDIDDIFYDNGIEMDYIEDWIESQI
jgi:hypothetical protein